MSVKRDECEEKRVGRMRRGIHVCLREGGTGDYEMACTSGNYM